MYKNDYVVYSKFSCVSHISKSHTHILSNSYSHILYLIAGGEFEGGDFYPHRPIRLKSCISSWCHTNFYYTCFLTIVTTLYFTTYLWDSYHMSNCTHICMSGAVWRYLDLSELFWSYLKLYGATWSYMELSGAIWSYPELCESI